ncbi:MAG: bifunctional phosphopantothenoylcysteine decarboxylase/phosphopantothenate--cysteine ligase CoaBC [Chloroflexi bacterium]|nr:bifunctional phosphopantothenoylcysteine decarboxylase/phosphopantothenate--cysteine ligase CoaBC [Chloroflexota bacterium]
MPEPLRDKHIVLGVTGSIACYKAADLASKLTQAGALVDVILSRAASQFITPLTFRSLTHRPVVTDLFDPESELAIEHVALATRADLVVVAPATAHLLGKLAAGLADDALTTTVLATQAPIILAPAMDAHMYENAAVRDNIGRLQSRGFHIAGPAEGRLASGLIGMGRLLETEDLIGHIRLVLGRKGDLAGRKLVVSAGGTEEPIDPVRVITNRSSGKMGYAVAEAARDRGGTVTLIAGPTSLRDPVGVRILRVRTALEMRDAVAEACQDTHVLIMSAAVADYRPISSAAQKLKKRADAWTVELTKNPDILAEVSGPFLKVGFAAETDNLVANAQEKLRSKGLHLVVANDVTSADSGFGTDTNRVVFIDREGAVEELPLLTKYEVGHRILDRLVPLLNAAPSSSS